jgi:hypothetical protein
MSRDAADLGTQLRKRFDAVRSLAVTIWIDHHQTGATKLNAGNSGRVPLP